MELNFEELDNPPDPVNNPNNVTNPTEINYINYWSNANPTINESSNPKKSKVSYDDILSSLNMVVNKHLKIHFKSFMDRLTNRRNR